MPTWAWLLTVMGTVALTLLAVRVYILRTMIG